MSTETQEKVSTLGKKLYNFETQNFVTAQSEADDKHQVQTEEGIISRWCIAETKDEVIKNLLTIINYQVNIIDRMSRDFDLLYVKHPEIFTQPQTKS